MKMMRKISALVLAIIMIAAVGAVYATSAELEENSEEGVAGNWNVKDTERVQADSINIKKEIVAYNPNNTTVYAPNVTYTYTITPAAVTSLTVTDEGTEDHNSNEDEEAPVKAGITTGLVVTGTTAGSAGNATSAVGTLVFTNTSTWTTATSGDTNEYDINLDFTNVPFTQPGVYRYQIVETIAEDTENEDDYDLIAMEDGAGNTLYLDVYVDGNLDIYGYVCMNANASVTPDTVTKINGFVNGTAADNSDKYYTYDLVLSKDVVNDTYAAANTAFPFTVFFNNSESYKSTFVIGQTVGTGSTGLGTSNPATLTLATSATALSGVAQVKDGNATVGTTVGDITFTGIPAGVDVDVYETNVVTGVTYSAESKVNGTIEETNNPLVWKTTTPLVPASAVAQTTRANYESTKVTVDTTKIASTEEQTVEIVNSLILISPTGIVLRVAPYLLMLGAGIALLVIFMVKRRKHTEEE